MQNLLVMKLREQEAESQGIVEYGVNEVAGMTQHDLLTWYFDFQAERCGDCAVITSGRKCICCACQEDL